MVNVHSVQVVVAEALLFAMSSYIGYIVLEFTIASLFFTILPVL